MPTAGQVAIANDGAELQLDSLAQTMAFNASNNISTITVVFNNNTYVQTYTYTGALLTNISGWVKQ